MYDPTKELYYSLDIESDGPIPGPNSMLSLGCAAFEAFNEQPISEFSINFETLKDGKPDSNTMKFWLKNQSAYDATRKFTKEPIYAMHNFVSWVEQIAKARNKIPVIVAYPAGFDFTFLYWYLMHFKGRSPFSFACLDIKTLAFATGEVDSYRDSKKRNFPKAWFPTNKHTHIAVEDAVEQGRIFIRIMKQLFAKDRIQAVSDAADLVEALTRSSRIQG
jgi:hypothetical protein